MAINLGSAYGKVSLDSSGIKSGVSNGIASLKTLETAGLAIGGAMQKIGGAMTLGLTVPITAFFKASIDSAIEAESALAELNAVIRSTGGAAGLTADEITHMAAELQKVTKFSDDQIVLGQSMLLTFTKIGKDVFPLATEAMLNMAEKFGSVDQAAIQLGKALNDPISGVGALRRVGVMLTDQQEDQIKGFMAVNDIASAQKIILQELEVEFGGLAKAAGDTTAGQMAKLVNTFDDLKEVVGQALIPLLMPLVEGLTKLFIKFQELTPFQQKMIIGFLGVVALAGPLLVFFGTIVSAIGTIAGFVTTLGGLGITAAGIGTALATLGTIITGTLIPAIAAVLTALAPILLVIAAIGIAIGILYLMWKYDIFGMRDVFDNAITVMKKLWEAFMAFLHGDTEEALNIVSGLFDNFQKNIQDMTPGLAGVRDAIENLRNGTIRLYEDGSGALLDLATAFGLPEKAMQDLLQRLYFILDAVNNLRNGTIRLYEDGSGALLDLAIAFGLPEKAMQNILARMYLLITAFRNLRNGAIKLYEDGSGALMDLATAFGIPEKAAQDFLQNIYMIVDKFRELIGSFQQAWTGFLNFLRMALARAREYITNAFTNANWSQLGRFILLGIANGLLLGLPALLAIVVRVAQAVLNQIKKSLGISSPSTEAMKLGAFTAQGFALGMQTMKPEDMARSLTKPITQNSNSNQQVINQHFASGLTLTQVRGMIEQNNEQLVNTMVNALSG